MDKRPTITPVNPEAVDKRTDTVTTNFQGRDSTAHVTRDVAAEQRVRTYKYSRILWTILVIIEVFLGLRFILKAIAANPDSGFSKFIYGFTGLLIAPFNSLVETPSVGGSVFEVTTLIAMLVYALLFWILVKVIRIFTDRSTSQTVSTRAEREHDKNNIQ